MNPSILPLLLACACLSQTVPPEAAAAPAAPTIGYSAHQTGVEYDLGFVSVGSSRETVERLLGDPAVRVGDEYWIYWDYRISPAEANPQGYDALIVTFSHDHVLHMKLSEGALIRHVLALHLARHAGATPFAAHAAAHVDSAPTQ